MIKLGFTTEQLVIVSLGLQQLKMQVQLGNIIKPADIPTELQKITALLQMIEMFIPDEQPEI